MPYDKAATLYVRVRAGWGKLTAAEVEARIPGLSLDEERGIEEARHSEQGIACLTVGKVLAAGRPVRLPFDD